MTSDPRLLAWREVLRIALRAYLVALRHRWDAAPADAPAAEIDRIVAAIGATGQPSADDRDHVRALVAEPATGAFGRLVTALGLSLGDEALIAAAWWADADPQLAVVLGCAHDDGLRRFASAALLRMALSPFEIEVAPALIDDDALVRCGVLEPGAGAAQALALTPTARAVLAELTPRPLIEAERPAPRVAATADALARHLNEPASGAVILRGPTKAGCHALAAAAARALGLSTVDGGHGARELRLLARAGLGLPIVEIEQLPELGWSDDDGPLVAVAGPGAVIGDGYVVDVPAPSFADRQGMWSVALAAVGLDDASGLVNALASRFTFAEHDVSEVLTRARRDARWSGRPLDADAVWDAARRQPQHALERLASLVKPAFTLADLVLDVDAHTQLRELIAHVELQHIVLDSWGFRRRLPRGQGVACLFAGPPGTGKTMAAEAVAHKLGQDLYRVDLSAVVSKYIGETEKNLAVAFDEAERASAVLFFDEADALFGKRTEVRDSHDRYANLEVNYLLQRVETFTGLVILATNRQSALDEAFARRLRFVVRFEVPDADLRAQLWQRAFPPDAAVAALDWQLLASAELSGGSIQAAALAAAYLAAAHGSVISASDVAHALRREYEKLGRAVPSRLTTESVTSALAAPSAVDRLANIP